MPKSTNEKKSPKRRKPRAGQRTPASSKRTPPAAPDPPEEEFEAAPEPEERQAEIDLRVKGDAAAVRRAARGVGGLPPDAHDEAPEEEEPVEEEELMEEPEADPVDEKIMRLLADGANVAIVSRSLPKQYANELEMYPCPMPFEQIRDDIFKRFGGEWFRLAIHPNTPTGRSRTLAAFAFKNPKTAVPFEAIREEEAQAREEMEGGAGRDRVAMQPAGDPYAQEDNSPYGKMRKSVEKRTNVLTQKIELQEAEATMDDLQRKVDERGGRPAKGTITQADLDLATSNAKTEFLERELAALSKRVDAPPATPTQDSNLITALLKSSSDQFAVLMTAMTNSNNQTMQALTNMGGGGGKGKADDFDAMVERAAKLKSLFGENDSRSKKLEELMYEDMMNRLSGGGGEAKDAEDTALALSKELSPILRLYVEKKLDQQTAANKGRPPTEEEKKALYAEAAQKAALDLAADMKKQGLVLTPAGVRKLGGGLPPTTKGAKQPPARLPAPKPAEAPAPAARTSEGESEEVVQIEPADLTQRPDGMPPADGSEPPPPTIEESNMEVPAAPGAPDYDRKKAVDFIMDIAISDAVEDCPEDTFLVGDIIDRLDPDLLDTLILVDDGAGLQQWLEPHADPTKVERLKELGADLKVKTWISRVVLTAQAQYRKLREEKKATPAS